MISGFLTQKKFMTSIFADDGKRVAVTVLEAKPLIVNRLRTLEKDGYQAVQLKSANNKLIEFQAITETIPELKAEITADLVFTPGDQVSATSKSKGRGFAGVIKRWGFHRQPVSGGASDRVRAPGSIGAQTPGKVIKGKKMPGHYGNATATVTHLKIVKFDKEQSLLYVAGGVPGHVNSWVVITKK
jgi:large subunit ribosomal protein L3